MVTPLSGILLLCLAAPVTYELDPERTELLAFTEPEGIKSAAHPHVIQAQKVSGAVIYDEAHVEGSSVKVSFPSAALVNDDPARRKRENMEPMKDSARESVGENMRAENQLDPKRFPSMDFFSTSVTKVDNGRLEVKGSIGIRGVRKDLVVPVMVMVKDGVLNAQGSVTIKHSDFNFLPYSAALGLVRNADEIKLRLLLVGKAKAQAAPGSPAPDAGAAHAD